MSRWLSVFLLLFALFGVGLALQSPATAVKADHTMATVTQMACLDAQGEHGTTLPGPDERLAAQGETDTVVDVTLLFEAARTPDTLSTVAVTPSRFGWTPIASPFLEGLQRPPRLSA